MTLDILDIICLVVAGFFGYVMYELYKETEGHYLSDRLIMGMVALLMFIFVALGVAGI